MTKKISVNASLDQLLSSLPVGSLERIITNNLFGINARAKQSAMERPKESQGYTFFTRPFLNLSDPNVSNSRKMFSLLTSNPKSYQRYTRMMLDPSLFHAGLRCPMVNQYSAFIPILTNTLENIAGWPDLEIPTYRSPSGLQGNQYSIADGPINQYESLDLSCTFRNVKGNPILYMMTMWVYYQMYVYEGVMNPYQFMILEREIDYNTRIYRITTNETNQFVTNIAACGAAFPTSLPTGSIFDFNAEKPYNDSIADVNIRFRAMGFMFNEDIIKYEFNQTQAIFSSPMAILLKHDMELYRDGGEVPDALARDKIDKYYDIPSAGITKVPHHLMLVTESSPLYNTYRRLNYLMQPYINLATDELEWWVPSNLFKLPR